MSPPLARESILPRVSGIQKNLKKLEELAELSFKSFKEEDSFSLAQHHLRLALEGVFNICSHILARMPGGRAIEYKEIARKMGEMKLVPKEFAESALVPMAGMRNLLVHAYSDIDEKKLYDVIKNHREDIEAFLKHVQKILKDPKKHGLSFE